MPGVAKRPSERLENLLLVVDEEDGAAVHHQPSRRRPARRWPTGSPGQRQLDAHLGAPSRHAADADRPAEALDDVLRDRQAQPGAAALGREVRVEDPRQIRGGDPAAAVGHDNRHAVRRRARRQEDLRLDRRTGLRSADLAAVARGRRQASATCAVDRLARVHDQIDQREAQPLGIGRHRRQRRVEIDGTARAGPGGRRRRRFAADGVEIRLRQLEANRPGEVEHIVHDPIEACRPPRRCPPPLPATRRADVGLPQGVQRRLDDHQRVPHFVRDDRRQAAERRQPFTSA